MAYLFPDNLDCVPGGLFKELVRLRQERVRPVSVGTGECLTKLAQFTEAEALLIDSANSRLETGNRLWPLGIYKGVVWEANPKLLYLGVQDQYYTFT